jgi:hypothetical protein
MCELKENGFMSYCIVNNDKNRIWDFIENMGPDRFFLLDYYRVGESHPYFGVDLSDLNTEIKRKKFYDSFQSEPDTYKIRYSLGTKPEYSLVLHTNFILAALEHEMRRIDYEKRKSEYIKRKTNEYDLRQIEYGTKTIKIKDN